MVRKANILRTAIDWLLRYDNSCICVYFAQELMREKLHKALIELFTWIFASRAGFSILTYLEIELLVHRDLVERALALIVRQQQMRTVHVVERLRRRVSENRCFLMQQTRAAAVNWHDRLPGRRYRLYLAEKREYRVTEQNRRHFSDGSFLSELPANKFKNKKKTSTILRIFYFRRSAPRSLRPP